ncbi:hypothetical protein C2E23DRAFT_830810 [Lenzites betulinus]|nr:hypothetical protein C2E23DRAFT_830810 [Lenzites betulinus]
MPASMVTGSFVLVVVLDHLVLPPAFVGILTALVAAPSRSCSARGATSAAAPLRVRCVWRNLAVVAHRLRN